MKKYDIVIIYLKESESLFLNELNQYIKRINNNDFFN